MLEIFEFTGSGDEGLGERRRLRLDVPQQGPLRHGGVRHTPLPRPRPGKQPRPPQQFLEGKKESSQVTQIIDRRRKDEVILFKESTPPPKKKKERENNL